MKGLWMKKNVRFCGVCVCLLLVFTLISACGASKLPEGFVESEVIDKAEQVVQSLSDGNYKAVTDMFSAVMVPLSTPEKLEAALGEYLKPLGGFKKVTSSSTAAAKDAKIGDFAVAVLVCEHENGKATYTISIDKDGYVCGLYVK